jgi:hypothetical protein
MGVPCEIWEGRVTLSELHHMILHYVLRNGYAPELDEIGAHFREPDRDAVRSSLRALEEYHGVVLHPNKESVWVIHPLSTAPTNFAVHSAGRILWGNCAWCSLGAAALLQPRNVRIVTTLGAEGQPVSLETRDGVLVPADYVVHFPVPMIHAWDNVIYTCSVMLVFKDSAQVEDWCARHRVPRGDIQPIERVWGFAREWYSRHLSDGWRKWTQEEAAAIFQRHGLIGPIWELPRTGKRF